MSGLRSVCVFSGSSPGARPSYTETATALGREVATRGLRLIHFSTCEVYGRVAVDGLGRPLERMREDDTALL